MMASEDRFLWRPGDTGISQCAGCARLIGDATCTAFPGGIPAPILENEHDHTKPYRGDRGLTFIEAK